VPDTAPEPLRIRPPRADEGAAVRMLLPDPPVGFGSREYLLAVVPEPPFIAGAVSYQYGHDALFGVRLRVVRTRRRAGIGRRLLDAVREQAAAHRCPNILATANELGEPDARPFLTAAGFTAVQRLTVVESTIAAARDTVVPLAARVRASGRMPAGARIVPLSQAPADQVARLYLEHLAHSPGASPLPVAEILRHPRYAESPVLLDADGVAGFLLWYIDAKRTGHLPARVVAPRWQGSTVNVLLLAHALADPHADTVDAIRWEIPENNADTTKLAGRLGARPISSSDVYLLRLTASGEPPAGSSPAASDRC
jgi:GNAT superfamily N-acetyltransferase